MPGDLVRSRVRFVFVAACAWAWLAGAPARAASPMPPASFDCAHAPGVDERLICADAVLRRADHDLGALYQATLRAAPAPAARAAIRSDERSWIIFRNDECRINKYTVLTAGNEPRLIDCFLDEYDERAADLRRMRALPGVDPALISHPIRTAMAAPALDAAESLAVTLSSAPPAGALAVSGTLSVDDGAGERLIYGQAAVGVTPAPRFVMVSGPAGARETAPPIRIDSRYHLAARYSAFAGAFVVSPGQWPDEMAGAVARRWAKTGCLTFWLVNPGTAAAMPGCIPFGPYADAAPVPLPTQAGLFFAAGAAGLFRVSEGRVGLVLAQPAAGAAVSADGCVISLLGPAAGGRASLTKIDVCKSKF